MATYVELRQLFGDGDLKNRVEVAVIVAAETIRDEASPTASRLAWAKAAFENPSSKREPMLRRLLAANREQDVATIQGVSDSTLQSRVDEAVDVFADGS